MPCMMTAKVAGVGRLSSKIIHAKQILTTNFEKDIRKKTITKVLRIASK